MNAQYFIDKFTAIPDDRWIVGDYVDDDGRCCALGHCGVRSSADSNPEADSLRSLFGDGIKVAEINNEGSELPFGPDPLAKYRIIAALEKL